MRPNPYLKKRSGIYGIYHPHVGKIYVGKTTDMLRRCAQYRYDHENDRADHVNCYLQAAFKKHGFENFVFFPLEFCSEKQLVAKELHWMRKLKSVDRRHGYNLRMDSSSGMVAHEDTREKIRQNLRRQWAEGLRDGHSEKLKARWAADPARRERQGQMFSAMRTKYMYVVKPPRGRAVVMNYAQLKDKGLQNVVATMHKKKSDEVSFKGYVIARRLAESDEK